MSADEKDERWEEWEEAAKISGPLPIPKPLPKPLEPEPDPELEPTSNQLTDKQLTDKHRRPIPQQAYMDIPMKRFRENTDPEKLELFLGENEKYLPFIAALHDPLYANYSFAAVCRKYNISLHELQSLYTDGMRHLGLLEMAANLPQVMVDVSENAKNRLILCPRCDGRKTITETLEFDESGKPSKVETRTCPLCEGIGKVNQIGDKHSQDLMFESMKLTGQKGGGLVIQQNFGNGAGGAGLDDPRMEGMLKLTQMVSLGAPGVRKEEKVVEIQAVDTQAEEARDA
jgi:hypothetical protein